MNIHHSKDPVLLVRGVNKYFYSPERFQGLNNVNFNVKHAELLAITGKSGSGKSTLLYLISGLDTDYEGEIIINGETSKYKSHADWAKFRTKHIGLLFKQHYLLPEFTVLENVMIPALKLGEKSTAAIEYDAMEKLKFVGVHQRALKQPGRLSVMQRQRVAIARALINNPAIIIGDEPTGGLDSSSSGIVFELLKELSQNFHQTIIVMTHDREFAHGFDRTIEISDGKIINREYRVAVNA